MSEETGFDWDGKETPYKISVLDYFAGLAMQNFLDSYLRSREDNLWMSYGELNSGSERQWSTARYNIAEHAYEIAKDMMSSRFDAEYERLGQEKKDIEEEKRDMELLAAKTKKEET